MHNQWERKIVKRKVEMGDDGTGLTGRAVDDCFAVVGVGVVGGD